MGMDEGETPQLEVVVKVVNINYGANPVLMGKDENLNGYAFFVESVRMFESQGMELREAMRHAMDVCIKEGIKELLLQTALY
jgi:hypothetical protein